MASKYTSKREYVNRLASAAADVLDIQADASGRVDAASEEFTALIEALGNWETNAKIEAKDDKRGR